MHKPSFEELYPHYDDDDDDDEMMMMTGHLLVRLKIIDDLGLAYKIATETLHSAPAHNVLLCSLDTCNAHKNCTFHMLVPRAGARRRRGASSWVLDGRGPPLGGCTGQCLFVCFIA